MPADRYQSDERKAWIAEKIRDKAREEVTKPDQVTVNWEMETRDKVLLTLSVHADDANIIWGKNQRTKNKLVRQAVKLAAEEGLRVGLHIQYKDSE